MKKYIIELGTYLKKILLYKITANIRSINNFCPRLDQPTAVGPRLHILFNIFIFIHLFYIKKCLLLFLGVGFQSVSINMSKPFDRKVFQIEISY